ncbi:MULTISPECIES: hypothetical protein [unclassified Campylobacter]|uniref:hypothetical protein n=1 Tax=unclassified Campylobacter TaxID=2593542 RepID=UPI001237D495|nr:MULTISPECIES: hypothetical protein [unclassified Campylobacter]KAA6225148.1 hypothetical protein FMM55_07670 [Campylobacter sp. LR196d]KAA6226162.1 hypothetical protein FMM54_05050 [Campylobacter sp. LR185c]KAA6228110.1 hypothetical protein FMM57_03740 [Campylobacter sp. LR286c]KAA6231362.1 hypothetical protein FMM56_04190 [Campylobacter sp. LR264d]KAA6231574.1 hypothetical protein FMM58_02990 [Campylobacter sp. LR291e]
MKFFKRSIIRGIILDSLTISGDDGNRYSFVLDKVQNLNGQSANSLINSQVDFEASGDIAKNIFVLNSTNSSGNLSSIKMMGYIYLFCYLLYMISFAGWFFLAIALVFFILASYSKKG